MTPRPPSNATDTLARNPYGPKPIGAVLSRVTRAAFRSNNAASARLLADWPEIVGPHLAGNTAPRRLSAGTLTIICDGPMAMELQHSSATLMDRINTHLGKEPVKRLRFVQEMPAPRPANRRKRQSQHDPIDIEGMPDGPLRNALAALGARVKPDQSAIAPTGNSQGINCQTRES